MCFTPVFASPVITGLMSAKKIPQFPVWRNISNNLIFELLPYFRLIQLVLCRLNHPGKFLPGNLSDSIPS